MKSWERDRWRKLYLREPKDQEILPWQTRGLRDLLIRLAEDDGRIVRDLSALRRLLRAGAELDEHFQALLDDGFLELRDGGIYVRNLTDAQEHAAGGRHASGQAGAGGRWVNTTLEQRQEAARKAAGVRWGRRTGDASSHPADASVTHPLTHADASDDASADASGPRAVSGRSEPSESIPEERKEEKREEESSQNARKRDASTHDATTHRRMTRVASKHAPAEATETLQEWAKKIERRPEHERDWSNAQERPELIAAAAVAAQAMGHVVPRLGCYSRDAGVRALVTLFAAGCTLEELKTGIPEVISSSWWRADGKRRGLSSITPEVLRRSMQLKPVQSGMELPNGIKFGAQGL